MPAPRWSRLLVAAQVAALVVLAALTVERFRVWAPVDEAAHYDYVQAIAEDHRLPVISERSHPEVLAIADGTYPRPSPVDPASVGLLGVSYEAFQPPLYYLLAVPAYALAGDHETKVKLVRAFDAVLLLAAAGLVALLARAVAPNRARLGFAAGMSVLLWPGVIARAVTVSPTALELLVTTALLLVLWRAREGAGRRWVISAGARTGACLLTKTTLVYVVPLWLAVLALDWRSRRDAVALLVSLALPLAMLAPWLAFNHDRYGTLTATSQARDEQRPTVNPTGRTYDGSDLVFYTRRLVFDNVVATEWEGQLDVAWVQVGALALSLSLFGGWLVLVCVRRRGPPARALWFFAAPVLAGYATLVTILLAQNWPSFHLRYLYAALPGLAIAVVSALPERRAWWAILGVTLVTAALWVDMAGAFYFTDVGAKLGI